MLPPLPPPIPRTADRSRAFTLVELLVSMTVLGIILLVSVQFLTQTQKTWSQGVAKIEQFREARMAFEDITQSLRQAVLNTYITYQYNGTLAPTIPQDADEAPIRYMRQSELQFVTGKVTDLVPNSATSPLITHGVFFQARLGVSDRDGYESLSRLLCGRGYFVMHGGDDAYRPAHVSKKRERFRLWEYRPPSEENAVYTLRPGEWFRDAASGAVSASETLAKPSLSRPVAENIIALIISPQVTADDAQMQHLDPTWIAPNYAYDSTALAGVTLNNVQGTQHLLPPIVHVTLVAIDEASAQKLAAKYPNSAPILVQAGAFTRCSAYKTDMAALEAKLLDERLNYRVFASAIALRNSKWGLLR